MKRCVVLLILMVMLFLLPSIIWATGKGEGGEFMNSVTITSIPEEYKRAVPEDSRASLKSFLTLSVTILTVRASW